MSQLIASNKTRIQNLVIVAGAVLGLMAVVGLLSENYTAAEPSAGNNLYFALANTSAPRLNDYFDAVDAMAASPRFAPVAHVQAPEQASAEPSRLIIRNGALTLSVEAPRAARQAVEQMVAGMAAEGAFVVSSQEQQQPNDLPPLVNMVIRVPASRFDETMSQLEALALDVIDRTESSQDVSEEYVDVQARLQSLEAARQRLLAIMAEAQTTEDLLAAEKQLTQREAEIEKLKGRLQYLERSVLLSSIVIQLRPSALSGPIAPGWQPNETVRRATERLVVRFQSTVDWWIVFAISDLPWLALYGLVLVLAVWAVWRWWQKRQQAAAIPADGAEATPDA